MPQSIEQVRKSFAPLSAQVVRQWRKLLDRELQPLGLTEATWLPLVHLSRVAEPMRQKELANSLMLDSSSIVRLLDNLQANGLIERVEDTDRRAKTIHLTARGNAIVEQVEVLSSQIRLRMLGAVPDQDLKTAVQVLARVSDALTNALNDVSVPTEQTP